MKFLAARYLKTKYVGLDCNTIYKYCTNLGGKCKSNNKELELGLKKEKTGVNQVYRRKSQKKN
jgi:hypothetical protein